MDTYEYEALAGAEGPPVVLVADADADRLGELARAMSGWGYAAVRASNATTALGVMHNDDAPEVAVIDARLPDLDLGAARTAGSSTYIVLAVDAADEVTLGRAREARIDDFIMVPFSPAQLHARLCTAVRVARLTDALEHSRSHIAGPAVRDRTTRLSSAPIVMERLVGELNRGRREREPIALMLVQPDYVSDLRDRIADTEADAILHDLARTLRGQLRSYDAIGRHHNTLIAVLPKCSAQDAVTVTERIKAAIAVRSGAAAPGLPVDTATFGIAIATPGSHAPTTAKAVAHAAEHALALASERGGNATAVADADSADARVVDVTNVPSASI